MKGGWQEACGLHGPISSAAYYVEGVGFAELDAEREWHYNATTRELFVWPENGTDLDAASTTLVAPELLVMVDIAGAQAGDMHLTADSVSFEGLEFR